MSVQCPLTSSIFRNKNAQSWLTRIFVSPPPCSIFHTFLIRITCRYIFYFLVHWISMFFGKNIQQVSIFFSSRFTIISWQLVWNQINLFILFFGFPPNRPTIWEECCVHTATPTRLSSTLSWKGRKGYGGEGLARADPGARTPIGASGNFPHCTEFIFLTCCTVLNGSLGFSVCPFPRVGLHRLTC
jgi:hypothetical protein